MVLKVNRAGSNPRLHENKAVFFLFTSIKLILGVAKRKGIFSVSDVISHVKNLMGIESLEVYQASLIQCLRILVQEGFIQSVFHPWSSNLGENMAKVMDFTESTL